MVGHEETRRNRVTTDIAGRKMYRKPLRKVGYTCLCRAICRDFGERSICVHRRNIDDIPARFNHILREYLRYQKRAGDIQIEYEFQCVYFPTEHFQRCEYEYRNPL